MSKQASSGEVPANVNVSGEGIQVGYGATQTNVWTTKAPLDSATLAALNAHAAVTRLQQLAHDELVDFFARARPRDVGEIIAVFLEVDEGKVIAALADICRPKATELIRTIDAAEILTALPEAAQEITRKAANLKWTDAGHLERLSTGYRRSYKAGHVFWSSKWGTRTTTGIMDEHYMTSDPGYGYPIGDQEAAASSPFSTEGIRQEFEVGTVYSSDNGTFRVIDEMCHEDEGASGGWLGFPIGEAIRNSSIARLQQFEGGNIYSRADKGSAALAVCRDVVDAMPGYPVFHPVSKQAAALSSFGVPGRVQYFESPPGYGYGNEATAVYSSARYGTVAVDWRVWPYYRKLGREKSWLGFPIEPGRSMMWSRGGQNFEGGMIYWRRETDPIAVPVAIMQLIQEEDTLAGRLGYPVSEEEPIGTSRHDRIQFFENGVATLQDQKREIWLRPDSKTPTLEGLGRGRNHPNLLRPTTLTA
jgi:uncharacterized protein with LGFP repeats